MGAEPYFSTKALTIVLTCSEYFLGVLEDQAKQIANNFIIQGLDKELMEDLSGYKFLPYVFELSALSNLSLEPIWRPTSLKSTRHFGYAIQWFALALVVLFGGYYLFRKKQAT